MDDLEKKMVESRARLEELHNTFYNLLIEYHNSYLKFLKRPTPYSSTKFNTNLRNVANMLYEYKREFLKLRSNIALTIHQRRYLTRYRNQQRIDTLAEDINKKEKELRKNIKKSKT